MANKVVIQLLTKGTEKASRNLGSVAKKIGAIGLAYMSAQGLVAGITASINAYGRQEEAEKKLATGLGKTSQALLDQASALQQVSRFGDEAIIEQQAYLASLGMSEAQIKEIIPIALDMAEATGQTLETAVRNTSKTLSGMAGELGELVPEMKDLTAEQLKSGEGLEILADLFEGQASEGAKTFSGQMDQMKNALGDTAEAIGEILMPIILPLIDGMRRLAEFTTKVVKGFKDIGGSADEATTNLESNTQAVEDNSNAQTDALAEALQATDDLNVVEVKRNDNLDSYLKKIEKIPAKTKTIADGEKEMAKIIEQSEEQKRVARLETAIATGASSDNILESIRKVIKAYLMEAIAGMLAKEISTKGLLGLITGAVGATAVNILFESLVPKFAEDGMNEVVTEPTMIIAGENGAESVNITPLGGTGTAQAGGVNLHFHSPVSDADFIRDVIVPEIENSRRLGLI
tara:strand:+ start:9633 stop:11018 length:1386 start_codon:yes stop_codon:yes gene_type:complete